jgi:hypothetical protein
MTRPFGSTAKLNGKTVRWAGDEYGWQSPASYSKLEKQGHFKLGRKELDALSRYLGPLAQRVAGFQQQVRAATPWLDPVEKTVNRAVKADDKLPSSRVAAGGAIAAQRASNALNLDPRLGMALPFLVGIVKPDGTFGYKPGGANRKAFEPHTKAIEERIEAAHQHWKKHGTLKGFDKNITTLPDGSKIVIKDQGAKNFEKRSGFSASFVEAPAKASKPASSPQTVEAAAKQPVSVQPSNRQQLSTKHLESKRQELISQGLPDPELRWTQQQQLHKETRSQIDRRVRDPRLPKDLDTSATKPSVAQGELRRDNGADSPTKGRLAIGPYESGTAKAGERYANTHLSEDSATFKVSEAQAHHDTSPLKDSGDFTRGLPEPYLQQYRQAAQQAGVHSGDTQLNTRYIRQPYHQGNNAWPEAKQQAVHPNLLGTVNGRQNHRLEVPANENRWAFIESLPPEQRLRYMPWFIADAKEGERLGMNAAFQQNLLQPGNDAFNNPFGGNLSQHVLAPESMEALKIISRKRREARQSLQNVYKEP